MQTRVGQSILSHTARGLKISRICLRVRDPRRSAEFYSSVLGLVQNNTNGTSLCRQNSADASATIDVVFTEGLPPGDHLTGLDRVSFEVPSRELVDQIYGQARKHNAHATSPRLYEGRWLTFVFDPDGYKIEVSAPAE